MATVKGVELIKPTDMGKLLVKKLMQLDGNKTDAIFKLFGLDAEFSNECECFFVISDIEE